MSKTYADQVRKARALIAGLKKNYEQVKDKGIDLGELSELEAAANEAEGIAFLFNVSSTNLEQC